MKTVNADVVIVGCGVAGLYCALSLPLNKKIIMITKSHAKECDSYLAQGGICMLPEQSDYESYFKDTMKAGHYENNPESVKLMINNSQDVIKDLVCYGSRFERNDDKSFKFTKEGAHSRARILFHQDITGKEITSHLLRAVKKLPNVTLYEHTTMIDIVTAKDENKKEICCGVIATCAKKNPLADYSFAQTKNKESLVYLQAPSVVGDCGGIGGLYEQSTNYRHLTGDALSIALNHNIPLQNPDYIQIHPTTLYTGRKERAFLISESVRGEGGILLDKNKNRFTDELMPRDIVANAIFAQMKKDDTKFVWLSMERIAQKDILTHFKHIYQRCLQEGYDCTKEPIPVTPAQHYFMGGVQVDSWSRTSLLGLYAAGEISCNGVHGKNRLASNSLLESLVFAKRAAFYIAQQSLISFTSNKSLNATIEKNIFSKLEQYTDTEHLFEQYKKIALKEIERMRLYHEQHIA